MPGAGASSNIAQVRSVASKALIATAHHESSISAVAFGGSAERMFLVTAGEDKTVRVWELPSGKEVARLPSEETVTSVTMSGDTRFLAAADRRGAVSVWKWKPDELSKAAKVQKTKGPSDK
jgi:WD40 repeat protein